LTSFDLLVLAAGLSRAQIDKMAHARGWPDTRSVVRRPGRVKWRNPYRNHWMGSAADPDWLQAESKGLAGSYPPTDMIPYTHWYVTDIGTKVVRLRLAAIKEAAR